MKIYLLAFLFVTGVAAVNGVRLHDDCSADATMCSSIANAECQGGYCKCKPSYLEMLFMQICIPVRIGDDCSLGNYIICDVIPNAHCSQGPPLWSKCACNTGYTASSDGSACTPSGK